ncbi:MAG TPA: DUF4491 family protein [Anaerolineales bacterium]
MIDRGFLTLNLSGVALGLGAFILVASLAARPDLLSAVLGLTGITFVWDGVEIFRQEKRMKTRPGSG